MVKKQTLLKIIELVQELDKAVKPIECSMIINDMEKVIEKHTAEQLNLHRVSVTSSFKRLKVELDGIKKFSDKNYKEDSKSGVDVVHLQMMDYITEEQKRY